MMCKKDEISGATPLPDREVLPTNVKPLHYDLILEPNFETFKYNGTVTIELVKKCFVPMGFTSDSGLKC